MHDVRLEDQLRSILRAEADGVPLAIGPDELERRLALRRRARQGRRLCLVAAAIAVVAIGSMVAITNGWLRLPTVAVEPTPSPVPTDPASAPPSTPVPSSTTEPLPSAAPYVPRVVDPLGASRDAVLVRFDPATNEVVIDLAVSTGENVTLGSHKLPEGTEPDMSSAPRSGPTGYLALGLVAAGDPDVPAGTLIIDMLDLGRPGVLVDGGARGFGWAPDGRLAVVDLGTASLVDPLDGRVLATSPIPTAIALAGTFQSRRFVAIWAADGSGLLAMQSQEDGPSPGILHFDGPGSGVVFEHTGVAVPIFTPTGMERFRAVDGGRLGIGCDSSGEGAVATCAVSVAFDGVEEFTFLYRGDDIIDMVWAADGRDVWLLRGTPGDEPATLSVDRLRGAGRTTVATLADIVTGAAGPRITGISPNDSRIAIDTGDGITLLLEPGGGEFYGLGGRFAGWADQGDAAYR